MATPDEISDEDFNELDPLIVDEERADTYSEEVTLASQVPVFCIVNGHNFASRTQHCRRCGEPAWHEVSV